MPIHRAFVRNSFCAFLFLLGCTFFYRAYAEKTAPVLSCPVVRVRVQQFLDQHYLFRNFDNELSKRTFKKMIESFDPGKYFFTEADVSQFRYLEDKLDDMIARADCKFLFDIEAVYQKRFAESQKRVEALLSKPFRFDVNEEVVVDRTKIGWAKDDADLNERWRKRIKFQVLSMKEGMTEPEAREKLKKRYAQYAKHNAEQDNDDYYALFLNSFALALDPHSAFMLPREQEDFSIKLSNSLEGIGATLTENNGYINVEAIVPGGAAYRDGRLKAGDKIIGVDSGDGSGMQDVIDMELDKAVRLIRGKKGTTVRLLVLRKSDTGVNERLTLAIVRDVVKLKSQEAKSDVTEIRGKRIGVIRLPSFYADYACRARQLGNCEGAAAHVEREVKKLQAKKVDGIVLDLRYNGGGDLQESIKLAGLFIPQGTVVQTVDRQRNTHYLQDTNPAVSYAGPLEVLMNKQSASASEIVTGALQDYGRAIVVGDSHTYGKGTVQVVQELGGEFASGMSGASGGAMKVTQSKFYRPSGHSNQEKGVESDVTIPSLLEMNDIGEKENDYVLPWDSIRPASDFHPLQKLSGMMPKLVTLSAERVSKDKDFIELKGKIEKFKKEKDKGTASLMEEKKDKAADAKKKVADKKKTDKKPKLKVTGTDDEPLIAKDDLQLREGMSILVDAMEINKEHMNWVLNN